MNHFIVQKGEKYCHIITVSCCNELQKKQHEIKQSIFHTISSSIFVMYLKIVTFIIQNTEESAFRFHFEVKTL